MNENTPEGVYYLILAAMIFVFTTTWVYQSHQRSTVIELAKSANCAVDYGFDERSGKTYVTFDYCSKEQE